MSAEQEKIKDLAYRLWQESGSPHGRDQEFWYQAELQVKGAKPAKPKASPKPAAAAKPKAPAKPKAESKPKAAAAKPKAPAKAAAKAKA